MHAAESTRTSSRFWRLVSLGDRAGGAWATPVDDAALDASATGVSIDTRTLRPGEVYVAIRGERFDGHDFAARAVEAGASAVVVERAVVGMGGAPVLRVDSTVEALQRWAGGWRDELAAGGCRVIAVGGSNGKTTTRGLIHHVLTRAGIAGTQSPKSFNNHLGVPLTLLAADAGHGFVVAEVGTNHVGEVDALARLIRPDAAVITSIGREHLEHFGSLDAVRREEFSLLDHVQAGGPAWTPDAPPPPYAGPLALPGEHNRLNAAAAAAVARWLGVDDATIEAALAAAEPPPGRGRVKRLGEITVIDDSYNANPDSMLAALRVLADHAPARRVAVLGDMFELGGHGPAGHREVLAAARAAADRVVVVGESFADAAAGADDVQSHRDPDAAAIAAIADALEAGDVVLLKGSRGMAMERILAALTRQAPSP